MGVEQKKRDSSNDGRQNPSTKDRDQGGESWRGLGKVISWTEGNKQGLDS